MLGFGKKQSKKTTNTPPPLAVSMHTIPDVFYGGKDPVIYHEQKGSNGTTQKKTQIKTGPRTSDMSPRSQKSSGTGTPGGRKKVLIWVSGGFVFCALAAGTTWYYIHAAKSTRIVQEIETPTSPVQVVVTTSTPIIETQPTSTDSGGEEEIVTSTPNSDEVSFPRILLVNSADTDADQLTDQEEALFTTNPDVWDTDGDGYYDGQEILNLYNPKGFAPVKLIDSGLISEYTNPKWQYRIYYPKGWQIGTVDAENRQVLISTISGDFVEVRVFDRSVGQTFQGWFANTITGETFQNLTPFVNRFQESGFLRSDGLVAYYMTPVNVVVMVYHPGVGGTVAYRNIMRMMIESFRPTTNANQIPEQAPLPQVPSASSTTPFS